MHFGREYATSLSSNHWREVVLRGITTSKILDTTLNSEECCFGGIADLTLVKGDVVAGRRDYGREPCGA